MSKAPKRLTVKSLAVYCHGIEERLRRVEKGCRRCVYREPVGFKVDADVRGEVIEQDEDDPEIPEET